MSSLGEIAVVAAIISCFITCSTVNGIEDDVNALRTEVRTLQKGINHLSSQRECVPVEAIERPAYWDYNHPCDCPAGQTCMCEQRGE